VRIIVSRIPPGSHEVAIWTGLQPVCIDEGQPIDVVCNIIHMDQYECIVTHALGDLSDEVNVAIGLKCIELGYRLMHWAVTHGAAHSHRGRFQKTAQGMDWYTVDLIAEAKTLLDSGATK
jgi:hypothetical protein